MKAVANVKNITTIDELKSVLSKAKSTCGGQFVTYTIVKPVSMNAYPTDGSEKVRRVDSFVANYEHKFQIHFGTDYDKQMAKLLGVDIYEAHDSNSEHLVPNVLKRIISTGNVCLISIKPKSDSFKYLGADGKELSAEDMAYMLRYKTKSSKRELPYYTISVKYLKRLAINKEEYKVEIDDRECAAYRMAV